jgi:UDP-N-acetyl-D-glucosamine dehydrogenase
MKSLNFEPRFIELAGVINASMPDFVVRRLAEMLNARGKALKGSRVLVLGVAYKPGVSDVRESPALDVIKLLKDQRAAVSYHDPHVGSIEVGGARLRSRPLTDEVLRATDLAAVLTAHPGLDYRRVLRLAPEVFDARNALAGAQDRRLRRL